MISSLSNNPVVARPGGGNTRTSATFSSGGPAAEHLKDPAKTSSSLETIAGINGQPSSSFSNFGEISKRYDLENMSPREVDALVEELQGEGYEPLADLMILSSFGEGFQSRLHEVTARAYGPDVRPFDPMARSNLKETAETQRKMAERMGEPVEGFDALEHLFSVLDKAAEARQGQTTGSQGGLARLTSESLLVLQEASS
jgi:hypothetical protein